MIAFEIKQLVGELFRHSPIEPSEQTMIAMKRNCFEIEELRNVLEGDLSRDAFDAAISHLDDCDSCRSAAESIRSGATKMPETTSGDNQRAEDAIENETACQIALQKILDRSKRDSVSTAIPFQTLGPYQLLELIGSGGMGAVYLAQHQRLRRKCAIKLLPPERVGQTGWLDRFDREMTTIASLEHANVVRATDAGHESGWHYLVMEHLDGLDVGRIASRQGRLNVDDACEIIRQAALGLAHIHDSGLVHRDIKPSNLMLTRNGNVKLLDLGLVLAGDDPLSMDERLTTVGHVMGTMPYMAPEQLADSRNVSPRSDIYSLGATLFRLIAGRPPHRSSRGLAAQAIAITNTDAVALDSLRDDVDRDVVEFVACLLSRDPEKRPQSAHEVAQRLEAFSQSSRLKAVVKDAMRRADPNEHVASGLLPSLAVQASGNGSKDRRRRYLIGLAAFFVLAVASIVITIVTDNGELIIESERDGVNVVVKQGERTVKSLEIESGADNRLKLRKGNYEIQIDGSTAGIRLSENVVTIRRGGESHIDIVEETQIAAETEPTEIKEEEGSEPVASPPDPAPLEISSMAGMGGFATHSSFTDMIRSGDKTLTEWMEVVRTETDLEKLGEAMFTSYRALEDMRTRGLGDYNETERALVQSYFNRAREFGGAFSKLPPISGADDQTDESEVFMWYLAELLPKQNAGNWLAVAASELLRGNGRSRAAAIHCVDKFFESYSPMTYQIPSNSFTDSRLIRGCVGLAIAKPDDSLWDSLPEEHRIVSAKAAMRIVVLYGPRAQFDPQSHPEFYQLILNETAETTTPANAAESSAYPDEMMDSSSYPVMDETSASPSVDANVGSDNTVEELLYQGKTLTSWLDQIKRERDVSTLAEVMKAVELLTRDTNDTTRLEAAQRTARLARLYGGLTMGSKQDENPSHRFMAHFYDIFPNYFPGPGFQVTLEELNDGNERSQMAIIWVTQRVLTSMWNVGNESNEQRQWIDQISADEAKAHLIRAVRQGMWDAVERWQNVDGQISKNDANHFTNLVGESTLILTLLLDESVAEQTRLVNTVFDRLDESMSFSEDPNLKNRLSEPVLYTIVRVAEKDPDQVSAEMWEHIAGEIVEGYFSQSMKFRQGVFDAVAKRAKEPLLQSFEAFLNQPPQRNHLVNQFGFANSTMLSLLFPFYAKSCSNPEHGLQLVVNARANHSGQFGTLPNELNNAVNEAIVTLRDRIALEKPSPETTDE